MKIVTANQMRELDAAAMTDFSMPGAALMENAGAAVVAFMRQRYGDLRGERIVILCGKGNNGGDGFAAARLLALTGAQVVAFALETPDHGTLARSPYDALRKTNPDIIHPPDLAAMRRALAHCDFVVDAMLGTGLNRAPQSPYKEALEACEALPAGVARIAVDLPSGLNATTGETHGAVFRAQHTVTFAYPKWGFYLQAGSDVAGEIHVADIGFPWDAIPFNITNRLSTPAEMRETWEALHYNGADAHKGDFGHVGIIAGSQGMVGAPALAARAAQRAGAGLVTVFAPKSAQSALAMKLNEQMTVPLEEEDGSASEAAFDTIARYAERMDVLCIGPGITTHPSTAKLVQRILQEVPKPLVLDADALNILAKLGGETAKKGGYNAEKGGANAGFLRILTPHPGEASRLLGTSIAETQSNRIASVQSLATAYSAIALLKGRHTLIANPSGDIIVNATGNAGMATGGSGDTLTGIIGGLLAQALSRDNEISAERVVALGAYLHGLAGDLAAQKIESASLIAGDIIDHIPQAIRHLKGSAT